MDRDYRGRELDPGIAKEIVNNDKADIISCDVVFVFYERPSVGTSMEVLFANQNGKIVVIVDMTKQPISPWLVFHATTITNSLDSAASFISGIA